MSNYTATNIRILDTDEVCERFPWAEAHELALTYKKPQEWIERGLKACDRVRVSHDYFIDRYLRKLHIPMREDVNAAITDLLIEDSRSKP